MKSAIKHLLDDVKMIWSPQEAANVPQVSLITLLKLKQSMEAYLNADIGEVSVRGKKS